MFKRLLLLVIGGLALHEAHKRGYLDAPSGGRARWPLPTAATHGDTPADAPPSSGSAATASSPS